MSKSRWILAFTVTVLTATGVHGARANRQISKQPTADPPSCTFDNFTVAIVCVNLQAQDMDLLQESLQMTAQFVEGFGVSLFYSDGPGIPSQIFDLFNLTYLQMFECNFSAIPYQLLESVDSHLRGLYLGYETYATTTTTAPDQLLEFSEYLTEFVIEFTNIQKLDPATFTQYTNLLKLYLDENSLTAIGLELLGMDTLQELHLNVNYLGSIETGAFRDLKNIQLLDLYGNSFSTLQDGAFMGLETSPITYINLSKNPWNCTCDLQWLKDWLNDRNLTAISEANCAYPTQGAFNEVDFCEMTKHSAVTRSQVQVLLRPLLRIV